MRRNDELRQTVVSLRSQLMSDSSRLRAEPGLILRESIRWSGLISAAGYHQDFQLDAVFLSHCAARALGNEKAAKHWARRGAEIAKITRGEKSRNAVYFMDCLK